MRADTLWINARLLPMAPGSPVAAKPGMIAAKDGRIVHIGPEAVDAARTIDCSGRLITPGLIDCHTHLVYAGNRATEFELRLKGASYEEIARAGGGIVSTMRHTREASEAQLVEQALSRLDALLAEGVTTVEIKSGYGLDLDSERKMLCAGRELGKRRPVRVATTFLGAHALPPEFTGRADAYIDAVCEMLPALNGLADAVDAFCEGIGFSPAQVEQVFAAAKTQGLPVKLHAEQLSNLQGAALAARFDALSADHLEHLDEAGVAAMARAGTIATLLPGAYYFTRETKLPPIDALRAAGVPIAIATDSNPGTSPMTSLLLVMNMAATLFRMTVEECLLGVTRNAAAALGLADEVGTLEISKACDLAIWDVEEPAELVYRIGFNPLHARVFAGETSAPRA
jgi:imidazolonepropionase